MRFNVWFESIKNNVTIKYLSSDIELKHLNKVILRYNSEIYVYDINLYIF